MSAVFDSFSRFYASSIGKKILVALTGLMLIGFVFGHLVEGEMVPKLMSKAELMEWFDALRVFEVGTEPDGSPIIYDRLPHVT